MRSHRLSLATTHNLKHSNSGPALPEEDERELVSQVQQAVDGVLGRAAERMGVDKADLARVLWQKGLEAPPGSRLPQNHSHEQWDFRR